MKERSIINKAGLLVQIWGFFLFSPQKWNRACDLSTVRHTGCILMRSHGKDKATNIVSGAVDIRWSCPFVVSMALLVPSSFIYRQQLVELDLPSPRDLLWTNRHTCRNMYRRVTRAAVRYQMHQHQSETHRHWIEKGYAHGLRCLNLN